MTRIRYRLRITGRSESPTLQGDRRRTESTAIAIADRILFTYADKKYNQMRGRLVADLTRAAQLEINWIAKQYSYYVFNTPAEPNLSGQLRGTLSRMGVNQGLEDVTPAWAPLNAKWIRQKNFGRRSTRQKGYFLYSGELRDMMVRGDTWTEMFGPIKVSVLRTMDTKKAMVGSSARRLPLRRALMTVRVHALTYITPQMLPALSSGKLTASYPDGRSTGLIGLVHNVSPDMAYRLGQRQDRTPYRPSLEPFLGFVLTQSLPRAILLRLNDQLDAHDFVKGYGPRG